MSCPARIALRVTAPLAPRRSLVPMSTFKVFRGASSWKVLAARWANPGRSTGFYGLAIPSQMQFGVRFIGPYGRNQELANHGFLHWSLPAGWHQFWVNRKLFESTLVFQLPPVCFFRALENYGVKRLIPWSSSVWPHPTRWTWTYW